MLPYMLTCFFPLAGTILSPAARCFSYSNDHNALTLVEKGPTVPVGEGL